MMLSLKHSVTNRISRVWVLCLLILLVRTGDTLLLDWFWGAPKDDTSARPKIGEIPVVKVPFEVTTEDEKFLQEAKKYTGLKLSDLDACQHHIVMKIRNSCSDMTEEELAKMSVNLLNCQSAAEGRQQFPCTSKMSLQECTSPMDSDMWNTYHLMSNRARAVCYAARQQQFRALSEMTVNKLMDTAHSQLNTMNSLKEGQENLELLTANTMKSVSLGHQSLMDQQEKLRVAQHNIQDFVALNLRQLTREKALIAAGHRELAKMTEDVKKKLDEASADLNSQMNERRENHKQLLKDLDIILERMSLIWQRIDHSTQEILAQHASAAVQYNSTLHKLTQINITVNFLLDLLDKTRHELDERLGWLANLMGGAGNQLDHLYSCVLHVLYLIVGMITASFIRAPTFTRAFLVIIVPVNLAATYHHGDSAALNFPSMTVLICASTAVHYMIQKVLYYWAPKQPGPMYCLHGSEQQPLSNGFISNPLSPVRPAPTVMALSSIVDRLQQLFAVDVLRRFNSVISRWCSLRNSLLASGLSKYGTSSNDRDCIPTLVPDRDIGEESSDSDEVTPQDSFPKSSTYSNYGSSDLLRVLNGTPTLRQRSSTPLHSPETPMHTSSRSGTPSYPGTSRPICRAICRNGQQCRNSASLGFDVCRRHNFDLSLH